MSDQDHNTLEASGLYGSLQNLGERNATAIVSRARVNSPGLNTVLRRRLAMLPGHDDSLVADPIFETAKIWKQAPASFGDLSGGLLTERLVDALDGATAERMPRDRHPYAHQLAAWEASRAGKSCLVSSGTGSGKTECFMVPMIDDLLRETDGPRHGVRAIVVYPLNALIDSQRERLKAWTGPLKDRVRFALYNGDTKNTPREIDKSKLAAAELGDRRSIRETPPSILVTNVTMLEYMLLRSQDASILEQSQGLLRWIVLDEAHSYVGVQAAEMALLLRRVRAAFGVSAEDVRLMATSATISEGERTVEKLSDFVGDLAGVARDRVEVIEGQSVGPELPAPGPDQDVNPDHLQTLGAPALWDELATNPRVQTLKRQLDTGISLSAAQKILYPDGSGSKSQTQQILDAAAQARNPQSDLPLLRWQAHLFHRAQGGVWACVDPNCRVCDPELKTEGANWSFGAVYLRQRDHCDCGAPVFELVSCSEFGTPYLKAGFEAGAVSRLRSIQSIETDEFAVDIEPEDEEEEQVALGTIWLGSPTGGAHDSYIGLEDGRVFENAPPSDQDYACLALYESADDREEAAQVQRQRLQPMRYGPAFLMGAGAPGLIESLAPPMNTPGLPMSGRRALTFSDSRQGTARLAAKLQQDAERNLVRSFLFHRVQQQADGQADDERQRLTAQLAKLQSDPDLFADMIADLKRQLQGGPEPISWRDLVDGFSGLAELQHAAPVWAGRLSGGEEMADDPRRLAEMLLLRELYRRPKVQNNSETMGLIRLNWPRLEEKARAKVPAALAGAGVTPDEFVSLLLLAIDFIFRNNFVVHLQHDYMARWINHRAPGRRSIYRADIAREDVQERYPVFWPTAELRGRNNRLVRFLFTTLGADHDDPSDQDMVSSVLTAMWNLIAEQGLAARNYGGGAFRLDFANAAVDRVELGYLCPVTRRIFGYAPPGLRSPYDPSQIMSKIPMPPLPLVSPGGMVAKERHEIQEWASTAPEVLALRAVGLWTDLHDRAAAFAPFFRAQEHSAQIERPVLASYENDFKAGEINVLNCSTTMEMGVDIPNVRLVVNSNVPPAISNYRQRAGRAGRRGEPWSFCMTFCRDLPLDHLVFEQPEALLGAEISAPAVRLDSRIIVMRHVHAALLGEFLRSAGGVLVRTSAGELFGISRDGEDIDTASPAEAFLSALRGDWGQETSRAKVLSSITLGSCLDSYSVERLIAETASSFETLLDRWMSEYRELDERAKAAIEPEVERVFALRASRMLGEFVLGELARRGFTPAYGFPIDVVGFQHQSGKTHDGGQTDISFGEHRGRASRTLDVAIREYAPGAEIVVDGLVHRSEGIMPAWGASADASKLEDLFTLWECRTCDAFGTTRSDIRACPSCGAPNVLQKKCLKPSGFIGGRKPHTGYESLGYVPFEMPRISAQSGRWQAFATPGAGRFRVAAEGRVVTLGSGVDGKGFALCLECGRAESEHEDRDGAPLPDGMERHRPLAPVPAEKLVDGLCPGGFTQHARVQRHIRFCHEASTDVFELQLPAGASKGSALALAAGIREALAKRLGAEVRELGVGVDNSRGPAGEQRVSAMLFDRAAGGAGLASRLGDVEWLADALKAAADALSCPEECEHGCPSCILRPDLSFGAERMDRPGALTLARESAKGLQLPVALQVLGDKTRLLGMPVWDWLQLQLHRGGLEEVRIFLYGEPSEANWDLGEWAINTSLDRLAAKGVPVCISMSARTLVDGSFKLGDALVLHTLATRAKVLLGAPARAGDKPVVVSARVRGQDLAVVANDHLDAVPGESWGSGAISPLVLGPWTCPAEQQNTVPTAELIRKIGGNATVIEVGRAFDGEISKFGASFWELFSKQAPLITTSIKSTGIARILYRDRYLMTPVHVRLLSQVITGSPAYRPGETVVEVKTAFSENSGRPSNYVGDNFPDDHLRRSVINGLIQGSRVQMFDKRNTPHERTLLIELHDGRRVEFFLDQGMGAWSTSHGLRHDFNASPQRQAAKILEFSARVQVRSGQRAPIILRTWGN